jgi:Putative prokaryotic signal transducing protein
MSREIITVARFRDVHEAILAKGKLESAGISAWLADENMVRMDWFWSNAIGGIRLGVRTKDVADALEVLESGPVESLPDESGEVMMQPRCPECGALEVSFGRHDSGMKLFLLWVWSLPLPSFRSPYWRCSKCGARWVDE